MPRAGTAMPVPGWRPAGRCAATDVVGRFAASSLAALALGEQPGRAAGLIEHERRLVLSETPLSPSGLSNPGGRPAGPTGAGTGRQAGSPSRAASSSLAPSMGLLVTYFRRSVTYFGARFRKRNNERNNLSSTFPLVRALSSLSTPTLLRLLRVFGGSHMRAPAPAHTSWHRRKSVTDVTTPRFHW